MSASATVRRAAIKISVVHFVGIRLTSVCRCGFMSDSKYAQPTHVLSLGYRHPTHTCPPVWASRPQLQSLIWH